MFHFPIYILCYAVVEGENSPLSIHQTEAEAIEAGESAHLWHPHGFDAITAFVFRVDSFGELRMYENLVWERRR